MSSDCRKKVLWESFVELKTVTAAAQKVRVAIVHKALHKFHAAGNDKSTAQPLLLVMQLSMQANYACSKFAQSCIIQAVEQHSNILLHAHVAVRPTCNRCAAIVHHVSHHIVIAVLLQ